MKRMKFQHWPILLLLIASLNKCASANKKNHGIRLQSKIKQTSPTKTQMNHLHTLLEGKRTPTPTTLDYYQRLLQQFKTQDTNSILDSIKQNELTREEIDFILSYLKSILAQQQPQFQQQQRPAIVNSFYSPNKSSSLLDLLSSSQPTLNSSTTRVQSLPLANDPNILNNNFDANAAYIPAIHGDQGHISPNNSPISIIDLNSEGQRPTLPTRAIRPSAVSTRIDGADIDKCLKETTCIFAIALLGALGFTGAIGTGLFFGKKRKKRDVDLLIKQQSIMDMIDRFQPQIPEEYKDKETTGSVFDIFSGIQSPESQSNAWKTHQDSANILLQNEGEIISPKKNENRITVTDTNEDSVKLFSKINVPAKQRHITRKPEAKLNNENTQILKYESDINSKQAENNYNVISLENLDKELQKHSNKNSSADHKESETDNEISEQLFRSGLSDFLSQIQAVKNDINISSNYENRTEISQSHRDNISNQRDSLISTLNLLLNSNSEKTTSDGFTLPNVHSLSASKPVNSFFSSHDTQNLNLQHHTQKESTSHTQQTPQQTNINENINGLLKLVNQNNKKEPQNAQNLNPLLQVFLLNQYLKKPSPQPVQVTRISPAHPPKEPISTLTSDSQSSLVPVNTVSNILQNPGISQQQTQSILSKLVELLTRNKPPQSDETKPIEPSSFVPPVIQMPHAPSRPSLPFYFPSTISHQKLSPETLKFYGLLCKSILEPNVPLNRVTAYIAEKCLVMRFLNVLKE